jgi:adenylylsulfate kinase-like enzyme
MTGVDDPYEAPQRPELAIDTSELGVPQCVARIITGLQAAGTLPARATI